MLFIEQKLCKKNIIIQLRLFLEKIKNYEEGIFNIIKYMVIPKFNKNDKCLFLNSLSHNLIIYEAKVLNKYIENDIIRYKIICKIDNYFLLENKNKIYNSKHRLVSEYNLTNKKKIEN